MAFAVEDMHDLARLLYEHPEWRAELRRLVLTDEILSLPDLVHELAEAQKRTEARADQLLEAQARLEHGIESLTESVRALTLNVMSLTDAHRHLEETVGHMRGDLLEIRYREKATGYFGQWLRKPRVVRRDDQAGTRG